jgi:hypothetical protein
VPGWLNLKRKELINLAKAKAKDYLTTAPKEQQLTIENGSIFPNLKNVPGDSVDELKFLEEANLIVAGNEIGQQNENL